MKTSMPKRLTSVIATILLAVAGVFVFSTPAYADAKLCSGSSFSVCTNAGYTDHGYSSSYTNSYWRATSGHNCTNYVGYMLDQNGDPGHNILMGNAMDWDDTIRNNAGWDYSMNGTPSAGAIAQWEANAGYAGPFGHVAYVESVSPTSIIVSEDNYPSGPFTWRSINFGSPNWPTRFLHIKDITTSGGGASSNGIDFNLDGRADIAWYEGWNNGTITALLATSSGGFSPSPLISGMGTPDWAGIGDFNADGRADIAWYHQSSLTLHVAQAGSNGIWSVTARLTGINKPDWAGVGDFNADGKDDIAWYEGWNNGTITALVSTGSGFSNSPLVSGLGTPRWAGVGDFNADGRSDIAWYHDGNNTLNLIRGNSGGVWSVSGIIPGLSAPSWAGVGDFNADGKDDIAWYEGWNNGTITALLATSAGGFSPSVLMSGLGEPKWAGVGDFNADGKDEIAWYHDWNSTLHLVRSNAVGVWSVGGVVAGLSAPTWASFT